jgi:hypothetical protein
LLLHSCDFSQTTEQPARFGTDITCQFSRGEKRWKFWVGDQWTDLKGRVQLWTSTYRPPNGQRPELWSGNSTSDYDLGILTLNTSIPSIASKPPRLPSLALSQISTQSLPTAISEETEYSTAGTASVQFVRIDRSGGLGAILQVPDSPCLVIFLPQMLLTIRGKLTA